jgi:hypothetical protein
MPLSKISHQATPQVLCPFISRFYRCKPCILPVLQDCFLIVYQWPFSCHLKWINPSTPGDNF